MPEENGDHAPEAAPGVTPGKRCERRAISLAALLAATIAGANVLLSFFSPTCPCLWLPGGVATLALSGLVAVALGIAALVRLGRTHFPIAGGIMAVVSILIGGLCALSLGGHCHIREGAKRVACKNNLIQIGIALHLYAEDNDGAFPPAFQELCGGQYLDNHRIFSCPSKPATHNDFLPGGRVTEKSSSFAYVPGLNYSMPGWFAIAYDKASDNHKKEGKEGVRNVLLIDSTVEQWPASREAAFQRRLALQNEAVAKWRASGKPVEAFGEFISPELRELMSR